MCSIGRSAAFAGQEEARVALVAETRSSHAAQKGRAGRAGKGRPDIRAALLDGITCLIRLVESATLFADYE